jgi:site-specific recombinase XerD
VQSCHANLSQIKSGKKPPHITRSIRLFEYVAARESRFLEQAQHLQQLVEYQRPGAGKDDCLFVNRYGRPLSRSGIADIIQRYAIKAATTVLSLQKRQITLHTLRYTTALHLLQSGVEVNVIRS